jgi:hypothetical protein
MMGRLAPGVSIEQANAELQVLWRSFSERLAAGEPVKERPTILARRAAVLSAATGFNPIRNDYSQALLVLMGMVALVLLLACATYRGCCCRARLPGSARFRSAWRLARAAEG